MAGDWLKVDATTPEKEEVLAITAIMGWDDADLTVGKLFRLWRWFDQHTTDGNAARVTPALLDRVVGVSGFCAAVRDVGWLEITDLGVTLPKFDRHNGTTAKSRALTAKRVAKHKSANGKPNATGNAIGVSGALPREEKRREELGTTLGTRHTPTAPESAREGVCAEGRFEGHLNPPAGVDIAPAVEAAVALRKRGMRINGTHPDLLAAIDEGVTLAELESMADAYPDKPAGYVVSAARRQHAEPPKPNGASHAAPDAGGRVGLADRALERARRIAEETGVDVFG